MLRRSLNEAEKSNGFNCAHWKSRSPMETLLAHLAGTLGQRWKMSGSLQSSYGEIMKHSPDMITEGQTLT
jgi:hypothetical protein